MATLNRVNCATNKKNTGFGSCPFDPDLIVGMILFGERKIFSKAEIADLEQTLRDLTVADSKIGRAYPISNFVAATDNTEDETLQTTDYGAKKVVRDGDYDLTFQFFDGGLCLLKALTSHNGPTPFLLYDKQNRIIGTEENGLLATIPPHFFYAKNWRLATGSTTANFSVRVSFASRYINQKLGFVEAGFDLNELEGLQDLKLDVGSFDGVTGEAVVTVETDCGAVNVGEQYADVFEANPDLFTATNGETGEQIAVESVDYNAGLKTFTVGLDTDDVNYPEDGTGIKLNLASISVLEAAGISGYEASEVVLEPDTASS